MERRLAGHGVVTDPPGAARRAPRPVPPVGPKIPFAEAWRVAMRAARALAEDACTAAARDSAPAHLHDYRVALRIQRALLTAFRDRFSQRASDALRAALRALVAETGRLRDIDVLVDACRERAARVPKGRRSAFDALVGRLQAEQAEARTRLARRFGASRHADALRAVEKRIETLRPLRATGNPNARAAVSAALEARRKKLARRARKVVKNPSDDAIHALRIDGKKLRYLVEFFQRALPKGESREILRTLKSTQDTLGHAHDLACQQNALIELLGSGSATRDEGEAAVVSRLVSSIHRELRAARKKSRAAARALLGKRFEHRLARLVKP